MLDTMERVFSEIVKNLNHPYSMWISGKLEQYNYKEIVFEELYKECNFSSSAREISNSLKNKLEKMPKNERKELVSRIKNGCPVLFHVCKSGNLKIAKYLIEVCGADPEQKGIFEIIDNQTSHYVSPLWAAAISGKLELVKYLVLEMKVDINSCSDSGSTVVRSACFMSHYEIVKFLIENGADILKPNLEGGNCLINAIQSYDLCKLLIDNGANVNAADFQNKTALHYAIQKNYFDTTVLLLQCGTNPNIKTIHNEDALCTACLKLATEIFNYLINHISYTNERIANAYELLGSTFLDEKKDFQTALYYWKIALKIRTESESIPIKKKNLVKPKKPYLYLTEFLTFEELENISCNIDLIRIQSLLIYERILGKQHKTMIFRLMYRGASYADNSQYQRCIDLWNYALKLRIKKDTILHSEAYFGSHALVGLYLDLYKNYQFRVIYEKPQFEDVFETLNLIFDQFKSTIGLLKIRPIYKKQIDDFDKLLKLIIHLLYIINEVAETAEQRKELNIITNKIIKLNLRNSLGDSILHLAVSANSSFKYNTLIEEDNHDYHYFFPNFDVAKLLLNNGANPDTINNCKNTPLHLACTRTNYKSNIVSLLLENGAHLDRTNESGNQPIKQLLSIKENEIMPLKFISLKCLAARKLVQTHKFSNKNDIPYFLKEFINIH